MKKLSLALIFTSLSLGSANAQNDDANWYFSSPKGCNPLSNYGGATDPIDFTTKSDCEITDMATVEDGIDHNVYQIQCTVKGKTSTLFAVHGIKLCEKIKAGLTK